MEYEKNASRPIGIHELSEFVFCPRAGLLVHGQQREDLGWEKQTVSNLNYSPLYELRQFDQALNKLQKRLTTQIVVWCVCIVLTAFALAFIDTQLAVILFVGSFFPLFGLLALLWKAYELLNSRESFLKSKKRLPDLSNPKIEEFDWRQVIRNEFDLQRCPDPFVDLDLGIKGRPWKLLKREELCIPIFRCPPPTPKNPKAQNPENWIYTKHLVRIAAYCALIESQTDYQAPFGLILFSGTYRVFAIKPNERINAMLKKSVLIANELVESFRSGLDPSAPPSKKCRGCPHGKLKRHIPGVTVLQHNGRKVEEMIVGFDDKFMHCHCGDLFQWLPPTSTRKRQN